MYSALNEEEIIKRQSKTVYKVAYSITSNRCDAEDAFQSVFLSYIKSKPHFSDLEHEKAWFIRVTINTAKNLVTQAWNRNTEELSDNLEAVESEPIDLEFALNQLTPQNRAIIYLFYYEGYKTHEIARFLKMKPSAVRVALTRSREKLKSILEKEGF